MRKRIAIVFILLLSMILVSCGSKSSELSSDAKSDSNESVNEDDSATSEDSKAGVEVDEGLLTVEITIPASWFDGEEVTQESLDEKIEDGIKSITLNDDGSVTYVVTKSKQKEMLEDMSKSIQEYFDEAVNSEDYSITKIEANKDYTDFTVTLTNKELNLYESFFTIGIYMQGYYYNMFAGNKDIDMSVKYINEETGETVFEDTYKEYLARTSEKN